MAQNSYTINQAGGQAGGIADGGNHDIISAADKLEAVPFGVALAQGASDGLCKLPSSSTDKIIGVAVLEQTKEQALGSGVVNYPAGSMISVMKRGRVNVLAESAVAAGGPVYVRFASGAGGSQLGAMRADADTGSAMLVDGASFTTSVAAGGVAVVDMNLPA
jgi:hypothetical protein